MDNRTNEYIIELCIEGFSKEEVFKRLENLLLDDRTLWYEVREQRMNK